VEQGAKGSKEALYMNDGGGGWKHFSDRREIGYVSVGVVMAVRLLPNNVKRGALEGFDISEIEEGRLFKEGKWYPLMWEVRKWRLGSGP